MSKPEVRQLLIGAPDAQLALLLVFATSVLPAGATAKHRTQGVTRTQSITLFTIDKSQNKNLVQYAINVDGQCAPVSGAPIFAYWRMLELGPTRVEPLLPRERSAYGQASQQIIERGPSSGKLRLVLRALANRSIVIDTRRAANGACKAFATIAIGGASAHLFDVYVKLTWHLSVDYLLLRGWSMDGARILTEKLRT